MATAQGILLFASLFFSLKIWWNKPYREWQRNRAAAEAEKLKIFRRVLGLEDVPAAAKPFQLQYVRAFLLDDQRDWFAKRARRFQILVGLATAARLLALLFVMAAAVAAFFLAVYQSVPAVLPWQWVTDLSNDDKLFAFIGVIGATLQTLIMSLAVCRTCTGVGNLILYS